MSCNRPVLCGCLLLAALLLSTPGQSGAETLCQQPEDSEAHDCAYLLIAGITEEPDPITMAGDKRQASASSRSIPVDVAFADGTPQIVSGFGMTVAVWSESAGGNGDIVFSEWSVGGWREHHLTVGGSDERDPRADIAGDGAIYVTWWEAEEPRRIRLARRDPKTLEWEQPPAFAGMLGSHPSVLVLGDEVLVANERPVWPGKGGKQVVVHTVGRTGVDGSVSVLADTRREAPLLVQLHRHGDRPFIDWIHGGGFIGYTEWHEGQWGVSLDTRPLTQRAWEEPERRANPLVRASE